MGYIWDPPRTAKVTKQLGNMTLRIPDRRLRPSPPQYRTPRAVNLESGLPAGNPDSVDEMYSNVALLLFLLAATLEAITYLGAVNWLPTRLIFMKISLAMSWIRLVSASLYRHYLIKAITWSDDYS
ncbi:hypothetical protein CRV24_001286 [Beauveria bassiana]|nr:hypothetical protein CRV24_001286 [Beauveria bassiana]KAH8720127.1 hypothetical protein HC256_000533 [Beauveria bassiana]